MSQSSDVSSSSETYFCVLCPQLSRFDHKTGLERHLRKEHFANCSHEEKIAIRLWIERHIKYQEQLNRCMCQPTRTIPDRNKTIYKGCPMCDAIIQIFDIRKDQRSQDHELLILDLNNDYKGNNVNHINPHLRYYPYECLICTEEVREAKKGGDTEREVVKTAVKAMMRRHIIDKHLKNSPLVRNDLEEKIEQSIKTLLVVELEKITKKHVILPSVSSASIGRPGPKSKKISRASTTPGPARVEISKVEIRPKYLLPQMAGSRVITTFANEVIPIQSSYTIGGTSQAKGYIMLNPPRLAVSGEAPLRVFSPIPISLTPKPVITEIKLEPKQEVKYETKEFSDYRVSGGSKSSRESVSTTTITPSSGLTCKSSDSIVGVSEDDDDDDDEDNQDYQLIRHVRKDHKDKMQFEEIQIDSSTSSDKSFTTSEEELSDSELKTMSDKDKSRVFGCVFCRKKYKTYEKAFDHYLAHMKIFIECAKCDLKFTSIGDFRSHNPQHNSNSNLKNVNEYKNVRKWVENFLTYITKERERFESLCRDGTRVLCPACALAYSVYGVTSKKTVGEPESLESHLHEHLNYLPFECMDCSYEDFKTEFFLNAKARDHLADKHNTKNALKMSEQELSAYFINKNSIATLDGVIGDAVNTSHSFNTYNDLNSKFVSLYLNKKS